VQDVKQFLLRSFPTLEEADLHVKATSQAGADLHLSPKAEALFPAHIEVKFVEALNIWGALEQARLGAARVKGRSLVPVVFFKRSRTALFVALNADDLWRLLCR
jgi:hypothetical protein